MLRLITETAIMGAAIMGAAIMVAAVMVAAVMGAAIKVFYVHSTNICQLSGIVQ